MATTERTLNFSHTSPLWDFGLGKHFNSDLLCCPPVNILNNHFISYSKIIISYKLVLLVLRLTQVVTQQNVESSFSKVSLNFKMEGWWRLQSCEKLFYEDYA